MFTDLNLTDMETCYKVFRREVIQAILPTLKENRFGIDPELTARIARRRYRVYEVGISFRPRLSRRQEDRLIRRLPCIVVHFPILVGRLRMPVL